MEQQNQSTTANRAPLRGAPREAHQRADFTTKKENDMDQLHNEHVFEYWVRQAYFWARRYRNTNMARSILAIAEAEIRREGK